MKNNFLNKNDNFNKKGAYFMKMNKCKLLIVACVVAISISSFGLSRRNVSKASSKPDAVDTYKKRLMEKTNTKKRCELVEYLKSNLIL